MSRPQVHLMGLASCFYKWFLLQYISESQFHGRICQLLWTSDIATWHVWLARRLRPTSVKLAIDIFLSDILDFAHVKTAYNCKPSNNKIYSNV